MDMPCLNERTLMASLFTGVHLVAKRSLDHLRGGKMRVNLTIKNISMRHAQKICRYAEKQGIMDDKEDIEIEVLK